MPRLRPALTAFALAVTATLPHAQDSAPQRPNYRQARQYSAQFLGQRTYSMSVDPQWIGETDRFWYRFEDRHGTRYVLVDPESRSRRPLFDHARLAAELSVASKTPTEAADIELVNAEIDDEGETLSFVFGTHKYSLDLASGQLTDEGEASEEERRPRGRGRFGGFGTRGGPPPGGGAPDARAHRNFSPDHTAYVFAQGHDLWYVEASDAVKKEIEAITARLEAEEKKAEEGEGDGEDVEAGGAPQERQRGRGRRGGSARGGDEGGERAQDDGGQDDEQRRRVQVVDVQRMDEQTAAARAKAEEAVDERERWADEVDESKAVRLTSDGEEDYDFAGFRGFFRRSELGREGFEDAQGEDFDYDRYAYDLEYEDPWAEQLDPQDDERTEEAADAKTRPNVDWAPDSNAFYAVRRDSRGVQQLFLVNSIAEPRPALETYDYPMPGEEHIRRSELFVFDRAQKTLTRLEPKWKDEGYSDLDWSEEGHTLHLLRRDRLLRNVELLTLDPATMATRVLLEEGFLAANIAPKGVRVLEERQQFIWWSECSGWGHFYLYGFDGQLVNPITSGRWLANAIVEVDEEKGLLYFRGNGREPGENIYYEHLYRVNLDGSGLTLMDPGDAFHRSELSPTQRFVVDNCSRVDMAPVSFLRDAYGNDVLQGEPLETADLSRLEEAGWRMPETFQVKAADGITDLFGNMWKPFDFDPTRKYPIIAEVYPGPQTEGVTHTFSASNARQQLAQIGFIVIQVGHRGGTPDRDKAYHSYGYFNLRDFGLEDKKAAIEELAKRHSFIDIERVGLYGHSGGGFMTAAAMMLPPYNEFFKVGVSSAGNHDNNIYNNSWSERYHGLREVAVEREGGGEGRGARRGRGAAGGRVEASAPQDERRRGGGERGQGEGEGKEETRFEIHVPTNQELAENLRGNLLLVHGEIDNNVHPANTMRLVDALIKANKRFDLLIIPGARHGFGAANEYFNQRKWEFFAEHLLGDHQTGADITVKE